MKTNRRDFIRLAGLAGVGLAGTKLIQSCTPEKVEQRPGQTFNMCGYAAPKLETVRIGFIGLGQRGPGAVGRMSHIEGVEIRALCDLRPERIDVAREQIATTGHHPVTYTGNEEIWKDLCGREDIDLVYICTPWSWR